MLRLFFTENYHLKSPARKEMKIEYEMKLQDEKDQWKNLIHPKNQLEQLLNK